MDKTDVQQNLEKTLNLMGSIKNNSEIKEFYSGINSLIEQTGYKEVEQKKSWNEYFAKQNEDGENLVFIKFIVPVEEKINHYGFVKVKQGKLEEFCERLNTDDRKKTVRLSCVGIGAATGAGASVLGEKIYYLFNTYTPHLTISPLAQTIGLGFLGTLLGAFIVGSICNLMVTKRNMKKLKQCYSLFRFDEEALKLAFSQKEKS